MLINFKVNCVNGLNGTRVDNIIVILKQMEIFTEPNRKLKKKK